MPIRSFAASLRLQHTTSRPALAALTLLISWQAIGATPAAVPHAQRQVLPDDIVPLHYDLALAPNSEALTFSGKVSITLDAAKAGPGITLNAVDLAFDHASLDGGPDAQVSFDKALGRATLTFSKPVTPGRHVLAIDYQGKIGRATTGFFAMDYAGPDGPRRTLATNFEPAEARVLLPCWDEPGRKATFSVSVVAPKDRMTLSNMPAAEVTAVSPTLQRVRFAQTPKMSTYLLYVGIGDFERINRKVDGVDLGIVVKRGDTPKAVYALEQASKLLHYYNDYFGISFPLPKLDLIAAPGEIVGGSMENWGAIFYSQHHLLFDPKFSTERDRQLVFLVVAHEMAHQWFGDLVTMAWWDDLWLNEGFARWMQTYSADDLHPEWETGLQAAHIFEQGKQADSVPSTHPVLQQIDTPDQATQSFDEITYDKGAAVITMLNAYAGRDKFREGVRRYMRAHAYGNTVDTDLWGPMQTAVGLPIADIEKDFTRQVGLPLVQVTVAGNHVNLALSRFADDPATIQGIAAPHWHLPLAVGSVEGPSHYVLLQDKSDVATRPPLLVNAGQLGYARVQYQGETFDKLVARLTELHSVDQLGLLNDAWSLGLALDTPVTRVLELAARMPVSANPIVWGRVLDMLTELDRQYGDTPGRAGFRRFALQVLTPLAAQLGARTAPNESANLEILRSRLEETRGRFGEARVIAAARRQFADGKGTAAEQRTALDIVARQADASTFDALVLRAKQTPDPLEKSHIFEALSGVADATLARRMIDIALGDQVPAGTGTDLLSSVAQEHADLAWDVLSPRIDDPQLPFAKNERWDLVSAVAGASSLPQRIMDLQTYEARSVPADARRPFLSTEARIRRNQRIAKSVLPQIDLWIRGRH